MYPELSRTVTSVAVIIKINIQTFKIARPLQLSVERPSSLSHYTGGVLQPQLTKTESKRLCDEEYGRTCIKTLIPLHHNCWRFWRRTVRNSFFIYFKEAQSYASKLLYVRIRIHTIRKIIYARFCEYDVTYVWTLSYKNLCGVRTTLIMNRPLDTCDICLKCAIYKSTHSLTYFTSTAYKSQTRD